jgi:hypothetical protein
MLRRLLILVAFVMVAALPASALADDAAVVKAWHSEDSRLAELRRDFNRASVAWFKRDNVRPATVLRVVARQRKTTRRVRDRVRAEQPSTVSGAQAKAAVLRSLRYTDRQYSLVVRGVRILARGRGKAGFRRFVQAGRWRTRSRRAAREARRLFEMAKTEYPLPPA